MKINRKLSLWILLIGMVCMPTEQAQARMMSNNTMYAIACTTFGAASYVAYMMYQDYCKQQAEIEKKRIADNNDDQEDIKTSFDETLNFFKTQLKGEQLAADFDLRIFTLLMTDFSLQTAMYFIDTMKESAHKQSTPISMKHFEDIILQDNEDVMNDHQTLLDRAYHQAAHAVAIIELMNPHVALYNVSLHGTNSFFCGFLFCPLVKDIPKSEDHLKIIEDTIMYYLAGGIGEQLFNVSPLPRYDDFDMSECDIDSYIYEYVDMISRLSVSYNIECAKDLSSLLLYFNYLNTDGSDPDNFVINSQERNNLVFSLYKKIQAILAVNNDKIKKLAEVLVKKGTVYADEAYAICGKKRPLFYFEKE